MFVQDLRYALRQLRRAPGFALTVALTLALSVGVATAVFCVIDTVIYFEARQEAGGLVTIAFLLVAVGLLAALIPAARAASIEPMQALRTE
jgi:ABC-type lipoprotein release transport system permease subunit